MRELRKYRCDFGHSWETFGDSDASPLPNENVCTQGHEAVTCSRQQLLDRVELRIRPMARIVDQATKRTGGEYEFALVLANLHTGEEFTNYRVYSFAEILKLSEGFKGMSFNAAKTRLLNSLDKP